MKTTRNAATSAIQAALVLLMVASTAFARGSQNTRGGGGPAGARTAPASSARPAGMQPHVVGNGGSRPAPHMQPGSHTGSHQPVTGHNPGRGTSGSNGHGQRIVDSWGGHGAPQHNPGSHLGPSRVGPSRGPHGPNVQHAPFRSRGNDYVRRTYHDRGRVYSHVYRPYTWHGYRFHAYAPARFFNPYFYGWAYNPWVVPVYYRWGWFGSPWLAYYGGYFTPYPVYGSASLWLTDYVLADALQTAYQEAAANSQLAAAGPRYGLNAIVKASVADEVRNQIALERAEAGGFTASSPSFLDGRSHSFVVSASMNTDQGCPVTPGDVLQIHGAAVNGDRATVQVLAAKGSDCSIGSFVSLPIDQLQEMQNHLRATLDQGLTDLRSRQGQGGLPAVPVAALAAPVPAPFASELPQAGM